MNNKIDLTTYNDFNHTKLTDSALENKQILVYVKRASCPYCAMMQGEWNKLCDKVKRVENLIVIEVDKTVFRPDKTPKFMSDLVNNTQFVPNVVMTKDAYKKDHINSFQGFDKERTVDNLFSFVTSTLKPKKKNAKSPGPMKKSTTSLKAKVSKKTNTTKQTINGSKKTTPKAKTTKNEKKP